MASTTALEAAKPVNRIYNDVFIKRRASDGSYEADWLDISQHVTRRVGAIRYAIDSQDFDVGIIRQDNVSIGFDNRAGKFNDMVDSRSLWASYLSAHLTKVRVDFGYVDQATEEKIEDLTFTGFIDERSMKTGSDDITTVTLLSLDFVFKTLEVPAGTLGSAVLASEALQVLLTRSEVTDHITIDPLALNPDNDITLDDPSVFNTRKLDAVLNEILLLTNSVGYIDRDGTFQVRGRSVGNRIRHKFYSNPRKETKAENVYAVRNINSGRQRVKNFFFWQGTTLNARSDTYLRERYGTTKRPVSSSAVTTTATQNSVMQRLRDEWQFPKQELELEVEYLGSTADILQLCTLDIRPTYTRRDNLPVSGEAVAGTAEAVGFDSGIFLIPEKGYKILEIRHDLRAAKTVLKLREKGKTLTDGYFDLLATAKYDVVFSAAMAVEVNTVAKDIDATCAKVELIDPSDDNKTVDIQIKRPSTSVLRFESPTAITKTFKALVVEILE